MASHTRVVLEWDGDVDLGNIESIRAGIDRAVGFAPPLTLVIDLGRITFIDSLGLGTLVHAREQCQHTGARLVLLRVPDATRHLLHMSGLDQVFTIED